MAPGQQNEPKPENKQHRADLPDGREIVEGARNQDQLEQLNENAKQHPDENEQGSPPKDTLTQKDLEQGEKTFEEQSNGHNALETDNGKNSGAIPAAFEGQQPNHP